jgi:hypothetical protein
MPRSRVEYPPGDIEYAVRDVASLRCEEVIEPAGPAWREYLELVRRQRLLEHEAHILPDGTMLSDAGLLLAARHSRLPHIRCWIHHHLVGRPLERARETVARLHQRQWSPLEVIQAAEHCRRSHRAEHSYEIREDELHRRLMRLTGLRRKTLARHLELEGLPVDLLAAVPVQIRREWARHLIGAAPDVVSEVQRRLRSGEPLAELFPRLRQAVAQPQVVARQLRELLRALGHIPSLSRNSTMIVPDKAQATQVSQAVQPLRKLAQTLEAAVRRQEHALAKLLRSWRREDERWL